MKWLPFPPEKDVLIRDRQKDFLGRGPGFFSEIVLGAITAIWSRNGALSEIFVRSRSPSPWTVACHPPPSANLLLMFLRLRLARLAGQGVMFSACSIFRPFIRSLTNFVNTMFLTRTNEPISMSIVKWSTGQRHQTINFGVKRSKVEIIRGGR